MPIWGWELECEYYDRVTSLSLSGCFLATKGELRAGNEIFMKLPGEIAGIINLKGSIRYQIRVMEGAQPTGAGVEFVGVSSENEKKLEAVLDNYR